MTPAPSDDADKGQLDPSQDVPKRWTKACSSVHVNNNCFSQFEAPPPTSFDPPPGSDVVPRQILTPLHHYLSRSRTPFWGADDFCLALPPRIYVDQKSLFREISTVKNLRRGDHCMITLNVLRCLSPRLDYLVSLMGSLEIFHLYQHFIILEDVDTVDEFGVPRTKSGEIVTIMEYSNTIPEFYEEARVNSHGKWFNLPFVAVRQLFTKARCHRVPLADYGDMPHIFRVEEKLSDEERSRIVADAERLLVDHPKYNVIWANCEHTVNMVSAKQTFTSPEVHFMIWSLCRYLLTFLGLAFLHFVTMQCYSRYCLQFPFWAMGAYYTCTALPVLAQIVVQYGRLAFTAVGAYLQSVITRNDLYHLLIKELCRAIFNGALAFGFLLWAPDILQFADGRYPVSVSVAVVFAYLASDMIFALTAQIFTRLLVLTHGHWWLLHGGNQTREEEEELVLKADQVAQKKEA